MEDPNANGVLSTVSGFRACNRHRYFVISYSDPSITHVLNGNAFAQHINTGPSYKIFIHTPLYLRRLWWCCQMHEHCSIHSSRNSRQWAGSNDFNTVEQNQRYEPVYLPQFHIPDDPTIDFAKCPTMRPIYLLVFIPPLSMELAERTGFQYSTYRLTMTIDPSLLSFCEPYY